MTRKDQKEMNPDPFMDAVIKNSTQFWEGMAGFSWPSKGDVGSKGAGDEAFASFNPWEPWEPAMEAWKQFQESCSPETVAESLKSVGAEGFKHFEEMAKNGWENFSSMGQGFAQPFPWGTSSMGGSEFFGGKDAFKELLKVMTGEMNRFINIPPLGLSRNYQGKMVEVVEKGNQFLLTLAEYMFLMFSPLEQAMKMVQVSLKGLTGKERGALTPEAVYETWLKELEQGYFALYGSEEYLELLKRLVSAMGEFNLARQNYMSDCLKLMGIPSENDLDDLYRDLYSIKKKLSTLENAVEKMTAPPKAPAKDPVKAAAPEQKEPPKTAPKVGRPSLKTAKSKVAAKSAEKHATPPKQSQKPAGKTP